MYEMRQSSRLARATGRAQGMVLNALQIPDRSRMRTHSWLHQGTYQSARKRAVAKNTDANSNGCPRRLTSQRASASRQWSTSQRANAPRRDARLRTAVTTCGIDQPSNAEAQRRKHMARPTSNQTNNITMRGQDASTMLLLSPPKHHTSNTFMATLTLVVWTTTVADVPSVHVYASKSASMVDEADEEAEAKRVEKKEEGEDGVPKYMVDE